MWPQREATLNDMTHQIKTLNHKTLYQSCIPKTLYQTRKELDFKTITPFF